MAVTAVSGPRQTQERQRLLAGHRVSWSIPLDLGPELSVWKITGRKSGQERKTLQRMGRNQESKTLISRDSTQVRLL